MLAKGTYFSIHTLMTCDLCDGSGGSNPQTVNFAMILAKIYLIDDRSNAQVKFFVVGTRAQLQFQDCPNY